MGSRIYVGNLPFSVDADQLRSLFEEGGRQVQDVKIVTDRITGRPRGFAFVDMDSSEEAEAAITALNGRDMGGAPSRSAWPGSGSRGPAAVIAGIATDGQAGPGVPGGQAPEGEGPADTPGRETASAPRKETESPPRREPGAWAGEPSSRLSRSASGHIVSLPHCRTSPGDLRRQTLLQLHGHGKEGD